MPVMSAFFMIVAFSAGPIHLGRSAGVWGAEHGDRSRLRPPSSLVDKSVLDQGPEGGEAVLPRDLLAFGVVAAVVGDGNLVHPGPGLEELGRDLGFDPEA